MLTQTLNAKTATVAEIIPHRGCGRDKVTIAHQFLNIPPYEVSLPAHLSLSSGKIRLQTWVSREYPKHIVVA